MPWFLSGEHVGGPSLILIDSVIDRISGRLTSHKSSWPELLRRQIIDLGHRPELVKVLTSTSYRDGTVDPKDPWRDAQVVILEHGMENLDRTKFNLFGGLNAENVERLNYLIQYGYKFTEGKVHLVSADRSMPDFSGLLDRKDCNLDEETVRGMKQWLSYLSNVVPSFERVYPSNQLSLGDSHMLSQWKPGTEIIRLDGQTLYGFLANFEERMKLVRHGVTGLHLYFGNIDIRHHLMREADPIGATAGLVHNYLSMLSQHFKDYPIGIHLYEVLPPETEARKIPKTGWYKDAPFYGSQSERAMLSTYFNQCLQHYATYFNEQNDSGRLHSPEFLVEKFPATLPYVDLNGYLQEEVMEKPQSVHLSRKYYRYDWEWATRRY